MLTSSSTANAPVTLLIAGPMDRVTQWYAVFRADARFQVLSFATSPEDLGAKLSPPPEVLLLDAGIFKGPQPLLDLLQRFGGTAYILLPPDGTAAQPTLAAQQNVKGLYVGDVNLAELVGKIYGDALGRRQMAPMTNFGPRQGGLTSVTGLRIISVWNQCGGAGLTTLAENLAYESARRGRRTLLIGLGTPDVMPLHLNLVSQPQNIALWRANPTPEAFKAALQKVGDLDVMAGFPDVMEMEKALGDRPESPSSINRLVTEAAYGGYAVIILDTSHSPLAGMALSASNTALLVARPTYADAWCSVEALRTLQERIAGQHRIAPENIYVALNRVRTGAGLSPVEWQAKASDALKRPFPPIAAAFPEIPGLELAQDAGKLPLLTSDVFARTLHTLADLLFGTAAGSNGRNPAQADEGKVAFQLGPLKIRTTKG